MTGLKLTCTEYGCHVAGGVGMTGLKPTCTQHGGHVVGGAGMTGLKPTCTCTVYVEWLPCGRRCSITGIKPIPVQSMAAMWQEV